MGRSLGVVVVGWVSGFLIAIAWGATRANNPRLASTLSGWAIAGMVVTGLLLLSIAVSDRAQRRRDARAAEAASSAEQAATAARVLEERSAARIAQLEARLAREQTELEAAAAALAAAEVTATPRVRPDVIDRLPDAAAADLEPVLRQEVVATVAELVGRTESGEAAALAGELEALLQKVR